MFTYYNYDGGGVVMTAEVKCSLCKAETDTHICWSCRRSVVENQRKYNAIVDRMGIESVQGKLYSDIKEIIES